MAIKIYRTTDKIPVRIGGVELLVSPLTAGQKQEIWGLTKMRSGMEIADPQRMSLLTLKYCVKEVKGVEYHDGESFQVKLDDDGSLTEECLSDLLRVCETEKLIGMTHSLLNSDLKREVEGVEVIHPDSKVKTSKKKTT